MGVLYRIAERELQGDVDTVSIILKRFYDLPTATLPIVKYVDISSHSLSSGTHILGFGVSAVHTVRRIRASSSSSTHVNFPAIFNQISNAKQRYVERFVFSYQPNKIKNPPSSTMFLLEDILPLLRLEEIRVRTQVFSGYFLQNLSQSMSNANCQGSDDSAELEGCRDESAAFILKMVAIVAILTAGVAGVAIPLLGKKRRFLRTDSNLFFAAKAFAAGVILATGFVHMLPDATSALTDSCLPKYPWLKFPFSGFFAMMAALATLLADFVGTQYYERKQEKRRASQLAEVDPVDSVSESGIVEVKERNGTVFGEEEGGGMHIVGMRAHAAHHRHNHPHGPDACEGHAREHSHDSHVHSHGFGDGDEVGSVRHVVVSQVLELGIVSHSIIIGLSLGVSQSLCTIRPLIAALSFHQFFEGFALGGCISQAQFRTLHTTLMACFFAFTTPVGIAVGTGISSFYNPDSPRALIIEGTLDSISAGILIYMALVDLIAADFLSKRMSCNVRLQVVSYFALFLGAGLMSSLAIWA